MATTYYFFDNQPIYQADWQKTIGKTLLDGVVCGVYNDCFVYGDASGMQIRVKAGMLHIKGNYLIMDADMIYVLQPAPATAGTARWDLVVGEVNWSTKSMSIKLIQGTASASPTPPTLTRTSTIWQTPLAKVYVAYGDTNVAASKVYDLRQWALGTFTIPFVIGAGNSSIIAGTMPTSVIVPVRSKIVQFALAANAVGSIVIDIWKDILPNYPLTVADTICDPAHKPTLSAAQWAVETVWNEPTYINGSGAYWPGNTILFGSEYNLYPYTIQCNVDSASGLMQVTLNLTFARMISA